MVDENNVCLHDITAALSLSPVGLCSRQLPCNQCEVGSLIGWYIHDWQPPAIGKALVWSDPLSKSHPNMHAKQTAAGEVK